jgi:hypothetical protein
MLANGMNSKSKRPVGITILAGVFLWTGCLGSILFPIVLIFSGLATDMVNDLAGVGQSHPWLRPAVRVGAYLLVLIWYLLYVAYACIGFGLWKLRNWARKAVLGLSLLSVVAGVLVVPFAGLPPAMSGAWIVSWISLWAWLAWYLMRPRVRFAFGATVPTSVGSLDSEPPRGLSRKENMLVATAALATIGLCFCSLLYAVENEIRHLQIYQMSLKEAARSGCVTAKIGSPFTPGWLAGGNMEESNAKGSAHLEIPIKGRRGKGDLVVSAEKQGGVWSIDKLILVQGSEETQLFPYTAFSACQ